MGWLTIIQKLDDHQLSIKPRIQCFQAPGRRIRGLGFTPQMVRYAPGQNPRGEEGTGWLKGEGVFTIENGGVHQWGYQNGESVYRWVIWGYLHVRKLPNSDLKDLTVKGVEISNMRDISAVV